MPSVTEVRAKAPAEGLKYLQQRQQQHPTGGISEAFEIMVDEGPRTFYSWMFLEAIDVIDAIDLISVRAII